MTLVDCVTGRVVPSPPTDAELLHAVIEDYLDEFYPDLVTVVRLNGILVANGAEPVDWYTLTSSWPGDRPAPKGTTT